MNIDEHKSHDDLAEKRIVEDVKNFGWHVALFEQTATEPAFAYTIGLWKNFGHPEIISFGLSTQTLHAILNIAGEKTQEGKLLSINETDFDFLENLPVQFMSVDSKQIANYFGYAMWFNEYATFPAIQLVWPDGLGNFPWNKKFDSELVGKQIILNTDFLI